MQYRLHVNGRYYPKNRPIYIDTVEVIGSIPVAPIDLEVISSASSRAFLLGAHRVRLRKKDRWMAPPFGSSRRRLGLPIQTDLNEHLPTKIPTYQEVATQCLGSRLCCSDRILRPIYSVLTHYSEEFLVSPGWWRWKSLGVHRLVLADEFVKRKNVMRSTRHIVIGERPRLPPWHSAANVVEERSRKWPEVGDGLLRLHIFDRVTADEP